MAEIELALKADIPYWQTTSASTRDTLAASPGVYGIGAWAHLGNLGLPSAATGFVQSVLAVGGQGSILAATLLVSDVWKQYVCRKVAGVWDDWRQIG